MLRALVLALSIPMGAANTSAVQTNDQAIRFYEIAAQPLESALIAFAETAKLSINFSGLDLSGMMSGGTSGHLSKQASLRSILSGTGLSFRFTSTNTAVIFKQHQTPQATAPEKPKISLPRPDYIEDLIVTAFKRPEASFNLPVSVSGVSSLVFEDHDTYDLQSLAPHLAGVSTTNLGPGRNKIFVRGLSDGPFADRTQTVVGVYIDETPINFNETNPDIRLFDVERIEVVRGPQGTLYGAGSLGGLYRIISKKPDLDEASGRARLSGSITRGGGPNGVLDVVYNQPLIKGKLGFRVSAYADAKDGYIDNIALDLQDSNNLEIFGVRPSLRWRINDDWTLDTSFNIQSIRYDDSQYFSTDLERNQRDMLIREPYDDDFVHASLTIKGRLGDLRLTSSSAFIDRAVRETADASDGLPFIDDLSLVSGDDFIRADLSIFSNEEAFSELGAADALAYFTRDDSNIFSHETRLQSPGGTKFEWLLGAYYLYRKQDSNSLLVLGFEDRDPELALTEERLESAQDIALFGEATYQLTNRLSLTAGARYSRNSLSLDYTSDFVLDESQLVIEDSKTTNKLISKAALRYEWSDSVQLYAQISGGYRVGGININTPLEALLAADPDEEFPAGVPTSFQSDKLINHELGMKSYWFDRSLSLNVAVFFVDWFDIQSDQIGPAGLAYVTNVGRAQSTGYEVEFSARPFSGFEVRGSLFWNDSELKEDNAFLGAKRGDRLPTIPEYTASIAALYEFDLGPDWHGAFAADYAYTGKSALIFSEDTSPEMGKYGILNAKIQFSNDRWKWGIFARNLTDSQANTFAYGNSFTLAEGKQITPPRPRTIGLFLERKF